MAGIVRGELSGGLQGSVRGASKAVGEKNACGFQLLLTDGGPDGREPIGKIRMGFEEGPVVAFEGP
jgi:hypothetical protein